MNTRVLASMVVLVALPLAVAQEAEKKARPAAPQLAAPLRLECDQGVIDSGAYIAHSGPLFADLDGDKKPELLVGNFKGHFQLYANAGETSKPKLVAKGLLQAAGKDAKVDNW